MRDFRVSVVIPALNAASGLPETLRSLAPAVTAGTIAEILVIDGGSDDDTRTVALAGGASVIASEPGRGRQLAVGGARADAPWLLFLHADTRLAPGWAEEAARFAEALKPGDRRAAAFRFRFDDRGFAPRIVEAGVALRCLFWNLPYGDQGLLISRDHYDALGGYRPMPLMEDVDIVRRIGPKALAILTSPAITSAERYRKIGYVSRVLRNWRCLWLYARGVPVERILKVYER